LKIVSIVGARPQFIKASTISRAIAEHNQQTSGSQVTEIIVHTGQHYDDNMSRVFFQQLGIREPDVNLGVGSGTHSWQTGKMLIGLEEILMAQRPDLVVVNGDTNSTLAGALASVKLHIPVAHVEAGLRSFNRQMPEEHNRVLTDHISDFLFCPTRTAVSNLRKEGFTNIVNDGKLIDQHFFENLSSAFGSDRLPCVVNVGDVMYDSVIHNIRLAEERSRILKLLNLHPKGYALATVHRAENTDNGRRLRSIVSALEKIGKSGLPVVIPLHPRTRECLTNSGFRILNSTLNFIDPVSYLDMLLLEKQARLILTDSGGVQKEAYWFRVPCITLRDETEWVETVESGWNVLAGSDAAKITTAVETARPGKEIKNAYGNGRAAELILRFFCRASHLGAA